MNFILKAKSMSVLLLLSLFILACNSGSPFQKKDTPAKMQIKLGLENCKSDASNPIGEMKNQLVSKMEDAQIYFQNIEVNSESQEMTVNIIGAENGTSSLESLREVFLGNFDLKFIPASRITDGTLVTLFNSTVEQESLGSILYREESLGLGSTTPYLALFSEKNLSQVKSAFERSAAQSLFNFHFGEIETDVYGLEGKTIALYASKKNDNEIVADGFVTRAKSAPDPHSGEIVVFVDFNNAGAKRWAEMTTKAAQDANRCILISINGEIVSAPRVMAPITGGRTTISGNFTIEEAKSIEDQLVKSKKVCDLKILDEKMLN